jgi:hypothetical protein
MENWVIFMLGLVLGIPLSILANIATPWVKSYYENRSLSNRERKILLLKNHYAKAKHINNHPEFSGFYVAVPFAIGLIGIVAEIIMIGILVGHYILVQVSVIDSSLFNIIFYQFMFIFIMILPWLSLNRFFGIINLISDAWEFDKYKEETIKKLIKLGGNPEDLDKE